MKFAKTFVVKGEVNRVFELTEKYVQEMKLKIINELKPTLMVLELENGWGSVLNTNKENARTTLAIYFAQIKEGVSLLFDYYMNIYGIAISSDNAAFESELEKLHNFLVTELS